MATMPSQADYYGPAEVPAEFDISSLNQYPFNSVEDQWSMQQQQQQHLYMHSNPQHLFKQEQQPCHVPIPKPEPISDLDYFEPWPLNYHHHPQQHLPGLPVQNVMSYSQTGSPQNQQLQLSDPPTPAAECQVTSTNLSPMQSPYSPHSEVGSYDGTAHGDSFFSEGVSHFDTAELTEVNIKGLTEEQLVSLTARDLNRICREMPEDVVKQLKKRRRTLKNRGYAYNSRVRRVTQKTALETERDDLKQQIQQLTDRCRFLEKEADQWKRKAQTLERGQL